MEKLTEPKFYKSTKANKLFKLRDTNEEMFQVRNLDIDHSNCNYVGGIIISTVLPWGTIIDTSNAPSLEEAFFTIQTFARSPSQEKEQLKVLLPELWESAEELDNIPMTKIDPTWEKLVIRKKVIEKGVTTIQ